MKLIILMLFFIWICLQGGFASMVHGTCWYDGVYLYVQGHIVAVTGTLPSGVQLWRCSCQFSVNASPAVASHSILVWLIGTGLKSCTLSAVSASIVTLLRVILGALSNHSVNWDVLFFCQDFQVCFDIFSQNGSSHKGSGTVTGRNSFTK